MLAAANRRIFTVASISDVFLPLYWAKKEERVPCLGLSPLCEYKDNTFSLEIGNKRSIAVQYSLKRSKSLGKTKYNLPIPFQINNQTKKIIVAVATMAAQPFIMCPSIFLSHSVA